MNRKRSIINPIILWMHVSIGGNVFLSTVWLMDSVTVSMRVMKIEAFSNQNFVRMFESIVFSVLRKRKRAYWLATLATIGGIVTICRMSYG